MSRIAIMHESYTAVNATSTSTDTYTVPEGKTVNVHEVGASACYSQDVKVEILVNDNICFVTHGSGFRKAKCQATAGQTIKIKKVNDSSNTETIGGYWEGDIDG